MAGPRVFISAAVIAVLVAYFLHVPLPEKFTERQKMHIFDFIMRLSYYYPANFFAKVGFPHWKLHWTRGALRFFAKLLGPWSQDDPDLNIFDTKFDGVPVRVYVPKDERSSDGAILYIHGGGFVLMDVDSYDGLTRSLARNSSMVTVSIDYRLAPEHLFPAGIEDCERATVHFLKSAHKQFGVDPSKVVIMGDSAGGNLAAVTTQRLRARKDIKYPLKLQVLLYPVVQYVDFLTPSYQKYYREYAGTSLLDPESIARWLMLYMGVEPHDERLEHVLKNNHTTTEARQGPHFQFVKHEHLPEEFRANSHAPPDNDGNKDLHSLLEPFLFNPDFSPLMHHDLSDLPRAMVMTCEFDILRDEGFWYAKRLRDHGVKVHHQHYDSGFHAMLNFHTEIELARTAINDVVAFVLRHV